MASTSARRYIYWSIAAILFTLLLLSLRVFTPPKPRFLQPPFKAVKNQEEIRTCLCNNITKERGTTTKESENTKANVKTTESTWLRDSFGKELHEIHSQLKFLLDHKSIPSPELVNKVGELAKRLDAKSEPPTTNSDTNNKSLDVCPEEYRGNKIGYPFYAKGWFLTNCTNAKPLRAVISILINTVAYPREDEKHIRNVLKGINDTYPTVQVHVATRSNDIVEMAQKYENIDVVKVDDTTEATVWNTLKGKASTSYVLVARDVVHFSWLTQIERQIRVVSQIPNVKVAGGAFRNISGHWKAGCVQTKLLNYVLEYQEGYFHSQNACMFCDYLQGPFLAKAELFKLDESLPNEVIFEDWFLRIREDGHQVMTCPDSMYFASDYTSYSKSTKRDVWTPLAKKRGINRVLLPQGVKHSFSCDEIGVTCKATHELLPICCLEEYAHVLTVLQKFCDERNISFELDSGSVVGGVKFDGLVPYDVDGDLITLSSQIEIFNKEETKQYFRSKGISLSGYKAPHFDKEMGKLIHGFMYINFRGFYFEVWGMWDMTNWQHLPPELRSLASFTKANIRGNWVNTACNPALYVRSRYGREILKHAQSWIKQGLASGFGEYKPGSFKPCNKPKHHSCLDNLAADGNIPFFVD